MKEGIKTIAWTFLAAAVYYALEALFNVIFPFVMQGVSSVREGTDRLILINLVLKLVVMLVFGFWYILQERTWPGRPDYRSVLRPKRICCLAGTGLFGQYSLGILLILMKLMIPEAFAEYEKVTEVLSLRGGGAVLTIVMVVVIGPLAEELLFRGVLYGRLRRSFTVTQAAVISAAIFGIYHKNIVQGVYAALFGLLLAYTFEKTQTIWGCVIMHMMFNLSSYLVKGILGLMQKIGIWVPDVAYLVLYVASIAIIIVCVWSLHKLPGRYDKGKKRLEMSEK